MIPLKFYFSTSLSQGAGFKLSQVIPVGRVVMAARCSQSSWFSSFIRTTMNLPKSLEHPQKGNLTGRVMGRQWTVQPPRRVVDSSASRKGSGLAVDSSASWKVDG